MNQQALIRQQIAALVDQYAAVALAPQAFLPGQTAVPPSGKVIGAQELKNKVGTRLLFAGNLTRQPYMAGAHYRISGDLTHTDNVMNNTFWIGVQPALTREMLEFAASKIESYLGVNF